MKHDSVFEQLYYLISKNEINYSIKILHEILKENNLNRFESDLVLLSSQVQDYLSKENLGLPKELSDFNRIKMGLITLVDEIKNEITDDLNSDSIQEKFNSAHISLRKRKGGKIAKHIISITITVSTAGLIYLLGAGLFFAILFGIIIGFIMDELLGG